MPCETEKCHTFKGTPTTRRMEYLYHKYRADLLTPEQITVIARIRWQIELMLSVSKASERFTHHEAKNPIASYVKYMRNSSSQSSGIGSC